MDNWHERNDHCEQGQWSGDDDREFQRRDEDVERCPHCAVTAEEQHQPDCPLGVFEMDFNRRTA